MVGSRIVRGRASAQMTALLWRNIVITDCFYDVFRDRIISIMESSGIARPEARLSLGPPAQDPRHERLKPTREDSLSAENFGVDEFQHDTMKLARVIHDGCSLGERERLG
jgi:hypothetical protein